jgi:hypothetical protein
MISKCAQVALVLCLGAPRSLPAQAVQLRSATDSSDALVLDHDFTSGEEFIRLFLQAGQVYRAELSSPDATLEIRGSIRSTQLPRIYVFLPSSTPSGTSILEVYPQVDLEYEIRVVSFNGSRLPTRMRLYRDVAASARRLYTRTHRGWDIGVELAGGWHSGFAQSTTGVTGTSPQGGSDVEACFTARNAPGKGRLGLCAVGIDYQSQRAARSITWVYTEPRLEVLGRGQPGGSRWQLGALLRLGLGIISASSSNPAIIAPGVYVARQIQSSSTTGWSIQASYSRPIYPGFGHASDLTEGITPKGHRLSLGLGWYR